MNLPELIEQKLNEAQHRRNQVLTILNSTPDATRPNQPTSSFGGGGSSASTTLFGSNSNVFEGDDRSLTNQYRTQRYQAPPPLCDVTALRVDDLVTSFLRFRRSLHHLCYHGQSSRTLISNDGNNNNNNNNNNNISSSSNSGSAVGTSAVLALHQLSEVGILQQRIDKVRFECFMMLEQLRDSAVNGAVSLDTTDVENMIALVEAPEVARLKASIKEEKEKLKEALRRLTIANYVPFE